MKISNKKLRKIQNSAAIGMTFAIVHTAFWGFVIVFSIFALIAGVPFDEFLMVFSGSAVFVALGVLWIKHTRRKYRYPMTCTRYFEALKGYSHISVGELAAILNEDPKQVRQNITYWISNRCVEGIYYTYRGDYVTVEPEVKVEPKPQPRMESPQPKKKQTAMVSVTCESCCGITMLPMNSVGICDYCGSKIKS